MNKEDKRGIFFGVVGVLTLIVAIIGATLAYFSINAQSEKNALIVQAASVQIVYEDGNKIEIIETKVDNFTSEMLQLINKYKIEDIELSGPKKYTKGIGTKVQEEYIKNYSNNNLNIKYI